MKYFYKFCWGMKIKPQYKPLILFATAFSGIICCGVGAPRLTLPNPNLGLSDQDQILHR